MLRERDEVVDLPPSVSDRLVSDEDDVTRRGDQVPPAAVSGANRDRRFFHGSRCGLRGPSTGDDACAALCFSFFNDDDIVNFFVPNSLWPRRLPVGTPINSLSSVFDSMPGFDLE